MDDPSGEAPDAQARPFAVPCKVLEMRAPLRWLALGWRDLRRGPGLSLLFGAMLVDHYFQLPI